MPEIIDDTKTKVVVDGDCLSVKELFGNVVTTTTTDINTQKDISIAHVNITKSNYKEPWMTIQYNEWLYCLSGQFEIHYYDNNNDDNDNNNNSNGILKVLTVRMGEICCIDKNERFRSVFPYANTEYIAICSPAFTPELCSREEKEDIVKDDNNETTTTQKQQMHTKFDDNNVVENDNNDIIYHMCQKVLWDEAVQKQMAYYPPTFEQDGYFTHATSIPNKLIETANHFYQQSIGEWICIELNKQNYMKLVL